MANPYVQTLTKDVWTAVLTNATYYGQVIILPKDDGPDPTRYLVTLRESGTGLPDPSYEGGVPVHVWTSPRSSFAVDLCIKPVDYDGKVEVYS